MLKSKNNWTAIFSLPSSESTQKEQKTSRIKQTVIQQTLVGSVTTEGRTLGTITNMINNKIKVDAGNDKDVSMPGVRGGVGKEGTHGVNPSGIVNITTLCDSGAESTSTIALS